MFLDFIFSSHSKTFCVRCMRLGTSGIDTFSGDVFSDFSLPLCQSCVRHLTDEYGEDEIRDCIKDLVRKNREDFDATLKQFSKERRK